MTRSILAALATCFAVAVVCGTGCASTGIGDPCTPEQEYRPDFVGFNVNEVSVESKSFQCQTRLCLVNHFQGRVSCPYGQKADGSATGMAGNASCTDANGVNAGCCTPGVIQAVTTPLDASGMPVDTIMKKTVPPQCTLRTSDKAVYCSCRCQNVNGLTNDGANYCTCPDGFTCTQLVTSIGQGDQGLTGGYCVKNGAGYDVNSACTPCDSTALNCGKSFGAGHAPPQ
jgi:hypothetical protein